MISSLDKTISLISQIADKKAIWLLLEEDIPPDGKSP